MTAVIHYHDEDEVDKVWWVQLLSLTFNALYLIYREEDLIMWQSSPLWDLSRNFL